MPRIQRSAAALAAMLACRAAPKPVPASARPPDPLASEAPLEHDAPAQPSRPLGLAGDTLVLALGADAGALLNGEQQRFAATVARAFALGDAIAVDQAYRNNLRVVRLLRGILSRPQVVPEGLLPRVRLFAREVWLHGGLHDAQTGHKLVPPLGAAELRDAALAALAAGADLGFGPAPAEYALRALEGPLFDPAVAPLREEARRSGAGARLARIAAGLEEAGRSASPPERAVLDALVGALREGASPARAAAPLAELAGPVDFFGGLGWDAQGRRGAFAAFAGLPDEPRAALRRDGVLPEVLLASAGALRPLFRFAVALPGKAVVFGAASAAEAREHGGAVAQAFADGHAALLSRCLPQQRALFLALREGGPGGAPARPGELPGRLGADAGALVEARKDVRALIDAPAAATLLDPRCASVFPEFVAAQWMAAVAQLPAGEVVDDAGRALLLELWWFSAKGALQEQHDGARRFLSSADPARFARAASELAALLDELATLGDARRLHALLAAHASRADAQWREDGLATLRARGLAPRAAVLAPRPDGKRVEDLDAEVLRAFEDWSQL